MDQEGGDQTSQEDDKTTQNKARTMTEAQVAAFQRDLAIKERQRKEDDPLDAARWQAARQALADGTFKRHKVLNPVVLDPNGPISTPEQLAPRGD